MRDQPYDRDDRSSATGHDGSRVILLARGGLPKMSMGLRARPASFLPRNSLVYRGSMPLGIAWAFLAVFGGCQADSAQDASAEPPAVPVSQPLRKEVTDYAEFTGQTKGVYSNDIIPQVTGYLVKLPFQEGAEVKKG